MFLTSSALASYQGVLAPVCGGDLKEHRMALFLRLTHGLCTEGYWYAVDRQVTSLCPRRDYA